MDLLLDIIQILTFTIVGASALASTILFFKSKDKDREKETYDYIDDKFNDFLTICMDKPYLDIFDVPDKEKVMLNETQKKEEKIAFAYLMSIFERVYVFYVDNGKKSDCDQLENWKKTIREYMRRDNFRAAWKENYYGWDSGFILFMDKLLFEVETSINLEEFNTISELNAWKDEYKKHFVLDKNNDTEEQLLHYLNYDYYHYYKIKNKNNQLIGGILTQEINDCVIILYIFVNKDHRRKGYADLAVRKLRTLYHEKKYFLAEIESRNVERKPFWIHCQFLKVNMAYFTPEVDFDTKKEIKAVNVNDLAIYYNLPIKVSALRKVLETYFLTSFVQDTTQNISNYEAVKKNKEQLKLMGKEVDIVAF